MSLWKTQLVFMIVIVTAFRQSVTPPPCEEVCLTLNKSTHENVYATFKNCCHTATECLLPYQRFYKPSCIKRFVKSCRIEDNSTMTNLSRWKEDCCKTDNNTDTTKNRSEQGEKRCFNVTVDWRNVSSLWPEQDDSLTHMWQNESWKFFLKMVSQSCAVNASLKYTSIKFEFPFYAPPEKKENWLVYSYPAPQAYLVMKKSHRALLTVVGESFKNLWIIMFLFFTWSLISGVIVWLLDHRKNPDQFSSTFWGGVSEGAWWAVVTMTTVGYGDKSPKSCLARIYSAIWMVVGVGLLSVFTAEVASGLTSHDLRPHDVFLGKEIGVPFFSKNYFRKELIGADIIEMNSSEDLLKHLEKKGNKIVLHECDKILQETDHDLKAVRGLKEHYIGISTKSTRLVKCVRSHIPIGIHRNADESRDEHGTECEPKIHKVRYGKRKTFDSTDLYILYVSGGLVAVMFIAGSIWDLIKAKKQRKKANADVEDNACEGMNAEDTCGQIEITVMKEENMTRKASMKTCSGQPGKEIASS